ncbi:hypothetical protein ABG768_025832 [Culter alburnus]|uniref:Uncharacterized protein n=1 Tax=Culter alburnus TaxID=194366 RepID=A0AAW2AJ36_CULAL
MAHSSVQRQAAWNCSLTPPIGRQAFEFETNPERHCQFGGVTGSDSPPPSFQRCLFPYDCTRAGQIGRFQPRLDAAFKDPRQTYKQPDPPLRIGFRQNIDPYHTR